MNIWKEKLMSKKVLAIGVTFGVLALPVSLPTFAADSSYAVPANVPAPADNKITKRRVSLGKKLFFDPRLSGSNWISCGTCHNPALGWSDGLPTAIGHGQKVLGRHTPTIINSAFSKTQFWDGRAKTLEEQALGPIAAAGEMNQDLDELVIELKAIPGYVHLFKKAYPGEGVSKSTIAKAIASYERMIVSRKSKFDKFIEGDKKAMSTAAIKGFELFEGKARCASCHSGFNFSDDKFHNIGINDKDVGRFAVSKEESAKGAFKTPTLRDISLTAPYMHNGKYRTLEEVVEHYDRGGDTKTNLSPMMAKLNLSKQEKKNLVQFMKELTGKRVQVQLPLLPQ